MLTTKVLSRIILIPAFGSGALFAQQYTISTIAGGLPLATPVAGLLAPLGAVSGLTTDANRNAYFITEYAVYKLDMTGVMTLVAGNGRAGYSGDGGPATSAQLNPGGLALDSASNLYIADSGNHRIRRVSPSGVIVTVAGSGLAGYSGDGGPAVNARLNIPANLTVDSAGNLYINDADNFVVRKVNPAGIITTVAGSGIQGYSGDGGPAIKARLNYSLGVAVDSTGDLYISDTRNSVIRKVTSAGIINTVAGTGTEGFSGDGGEATAAELNMPEGIALDNSGNLYIADQYNHRVREVTQNGTITTFAGNGKAGYSGDQGLATSAELDYPESVAVDASGNLYIADDRVRFVNAGGVISTLAGNDASPFSGDGGPAILARLCCPVGVVADNARNVYFTDPYNRRVRKIAPDGTISTVAGSGVYGSSGDGGPATSAALSFPEGLALDGSGDLYIADTEANSIRRIAVNGVITTVAGNGSQGFSGDGGQATAAMLNFPYGVAADNAGNLFIVDTDNQRIRKVSSTGVITTIAGTGNQGYSGDGGPATSANLNFPYGIATDSLGNVYVADLDNFRIRKISASGIITTIAGTGTAGYSGDGGPATSANLNIPSGLALDTVGNLYIADSDNYRIRKVSSAGVISTVAGSGGETYSGDGGLAALATFIDPAGVAVDNSGAIYTADIGAFAIRKLTPWNQTTQITAVLDAASESAIPISPGKIITIYGLAMGPSALVVNQPANNAFGTTAGGTAVTINGTPAPIIYSSSGQVAAIVPYEIAGSSTAQITVSYQGQISPAVTVPVVPSAPSFFSANATGAGQIAAVNLDGSLNSPSFPVKPGGYVSLYATGEGQTSPSGIDGMLASSTPYPAPVLPVSVTVGGINATVAYAGAAPTEVAGLMQVVVQIPSGVQSGGYVPVVLKVGGSSTTDGAAWISVSGN